MTDKTVTQVINELVELRTIRPEWWIERQARLLTQRLEEMPVGHSVLVSDATALDLQEADIRKVLEQFPADAFKVFARFGGCEILKQKAKKES